MPTRALLVPGTPTPERRVPAHIARPEYVGKASPAPNTWPDVQPPEVIEAMRVAGRIAAQALAAGGAAVAPGVTTDEIDRVVHEFLVDHGAYPSTLGYKGFPKSCCTSLNEVVCHGIPDTTVIEDGDIVNIDVTAFIGGRARRHQRHVPRGRRRRGVAAAGRAHPRGDDAGDQGGATGPRARPSSAA